MPLPRLAVRGGKRSLRAYSSGTKTYRPQCEDTSACCRRGISFAASFGVCCFFCCAGAINDPTYGRLSNFEFAWTCLYETEWCAESDKSVANADRLVAPSLVDARALSGPAAEGTAISIKRCFIDHFYAFLGTRMCFTVLRCRCASVARAIQMVPHRVFI